jgi:hypothetical protein
MERKTHEIGRQDAKRIAETWLDGKYSQYTVYDMVVGKAKMQPIVRDAIDAYLKVQDVAEITHEVLMKDARERWKRFQNNVKHLEDHDQAQVALADDEVHSQVNPLADAWDGRDLTPAEKAVNRSLQLHNA